MEVIDFPGAAQLNKKTKQGYKREKISNSPENKILLGEVEFTCPTCRTETKIDFKNLIFRSLDFHCSNCGSRHKISNPAFSTVTSKPSRKIKGQ